MVFKPDFHSKSIYLNPPSPEVDNAWSELYYGLQTILCIAESSLTQVLTEDYVSLQIPHSQAQMLPNKSLAVPADPANVWIGLSVFHQLHCLVSIYLLLTKLSTDTIAIGHYSEGPSP